jgi:hypothetical protein
LEFDRLTVPLAPLILTVVVCPTVIVTLLTATASFAVARWLLCCSLWLSATASVPDAKEKAAMSPPKIKRPLMAISS